MLAVFAAITSVTWALYNLKPSLLRLPGLGQRANTKNTMTISAPREATMRLLSTEKAVPATSGFFGSKGGGQTAVTLIRGTSAGSDGGERTLRNSTQQVTTSALYSEPDGNAGFDTLTKHRGIQTEMVDGGHSVETTPGVTPRDPAGGFSSSYIESTFVQNFYTSQRAAAASGVDDDAFQANGCVTSSPLTSATDASMFQMKNMALSTTVTTTATNLMTTAEQIRVDCVQLTNNGRFVVTGSIYGPPQVWDLKVMTRTFLSAF
jgi:hypothetical protein